MEQLKVVIRIRPFLPNENSSKTGLEIDAENSQKIEVSKSLKKFSATYDRVLSQNCTQKEVFNFIKPCLKYIKKGINCTILAYGQTGSGKTYTMFGGEWAMNDKSTDYEIRKKFNKKDKYNFILNDELTIDPFSETNGIIPNLIMNLFQTYGTYDATENNIIITCSYIQIYNEQVYDLLIDEAEMMEEKKTFNLVTGVGKNINEKPIKQKPLKIKYDRKNGVTIDGVNEVRTPTFYDIFEILRQGEINRKIRQTHKNEMSSRSHTIFIINIQDIKNKVFSKIKLCDLAGSERYDSRESYKKLHFNEMCNINKSLLVLGNVIHFLGQNNSFINIPKKNDKNQKNQKTFAPYKDSKLTQILEDSLGGNSITYLIANISPCEESFDETVSTLQFADRAHSIMTQVSMNQINDRNPGINPKEFNKICDELSQLKQLLYIRKKRGTLEPIQEELIKLKDENSQLKKYLGGENNINRMQELIVENKNLRKEIKNLKDINQNLKNEINSKPISHLSSELNNDNNNNINNRNVFSEKKINRGNNNDDTNYNNDINNNYNKLKNNLNKNNDINSNNDINNNYNKLKNNLNNNNDINYDNDIINNYNNLKKILDNNNKTGKDSNINFNNNNQINYNKYDIDDILDNDEKNNDNDNENEYSLIKNNKKSTKKNVFLESGQNIIYGSKGLDKNEKENNGEKEHMYDDEFNDLIYDDFDYDINENNINDYSKSNKSKTNTNRSKTNTNKSKNINLKLSKLNKAATPYERLQLLEQLEMENKKKTQELIDNITKNNKNADDD